MSGNRLESFTMPLSGHLLLSSHCLHDILEDDDSDPIQFNKNLSKLLHKILYMTRSYYVFLLCSTTECFWSKLLWLTSQMKQRHVREGTDVP